MSGRVTVPKPTLSVRDVGSLVVGMVVGAGIFETPALVASNAGNTSTVLFAWLLGGIMSLVGALCYAELATAYPHSGGTYYYLKRAFGKSIGFLFIWARMSVIQTGSITLAAFVFGDYASQLLPLGEYSSSLYAAAAIILLTGLNILGVWQGKWTQVALTATAVFGLLLLIGFGLMFASPSTATAPESPADQTNFGLAMVFVLLTYGGWNEAAYVSAELYQNEHNMLRVLLVSIALITGIYLLINLTYLQGLGLAGMSNSEAVATDLMDNAMGESSAILISLLIAICTLGTTNAAIFTGARTNYALGQDFSLFSFLGRWNDHTKTPTSALSVQGLIALGLVLLGTLTRQGFETMVDYTAPVFWFFFLLSGVALLILRRREPELSRPFRVPAYPWLPLIFCGMSGYLLYSSLTYAGIGALLGVLIVVAGAPLLWLHRDRGSQNNNTN
ncbi:MAG: amino acid permease [Cyanobacteria bacterium SW_9_44_58]|nr:MAG: amino acid permease [Cyanobacteria bacterium SW_9_44_58]